MHLACALWVPEVTLSSPEAMSGVRLDALSPDRNSLACTICRQVCMLPCNFPASSACSLLGCTTLHAAKVGCRAHQYAEPQLG